MQTHAKVFFETQPQCFSKFTIYFSVADSVFKTISPLMADSGTIPSISLY